MRTTPTNNEFYNDQYNSLTECLKEVENALELDPGNTSLKYDVEYYKKRLRQSSYETTTWI